MSTQLNQDLKSFETKQLSLADRIFRDREGNLVIVQPPNLPILVGTTAAILHFVLPPGNLHALAGLVAYGVLFTWAWLEIFSGVNYFRRGLGLLVLGGLIALEMGLINFPV